MNAARSVMVALLACTAALAAGKAVAQPHSEPQISFISLQPVTDPAAISEWLQRLTGRFRFDGMVQMTAACAEVPAGGGPPPPPSDLCQGVKGVSDCVKVGTGAGVQCILNVFWQDMYAVDFENGTSREILASYLDPAVELFGLDPGNSAINRLLVDNKGLPEGGLGFVKGNTATFRSRCVNKPAGCYRTIRIEARADARLVYWWLSTQNEPEPETTYGVMTLRRLAVEEEGSATLQPKSKRK